MHLPEAPLTCRGLRGARRHLGAGVCAVVREVAEHVDEAITKRLAEPLEHVAEAPAVGAQEVLVGDDDGGEIVLHAADVVARAVEGPQQPQRGSSGLGWARGWLAVARTAIHLGPRMMPRRYPAERS